MNAANIIAVNTEVGNTYNPTELWIGQGIAHMLAIKIKVFRELMVMNMTIQLITRWKCFGAHNSFGGRH